MFRVFHVSFWCLQWHRIFKIFHHVIIIFLHKCLRISHFLLFLSWNTKFPIDNHRTNDIVKLRIISRKCLSTFYQYFLSTKKYMIITTECPKNGSCLMPYKDKRKIDWPKHKINYSKLDLIHHLDFKLYLKLFFWFLRLLMVGGYLEKCLNHCRIIWKYFHFWTKLVWVANNLCLIS